MYTLTTTLELPIAHRLETAFSGLCVGNIGIDGQPTQGNKIIHGHNYILTFEISTNQLNSDDMVIDFKKIKEIIHKVFDKYDHSLIVKNTDDILSYYENNSSNSRLFVWTHNPTAEYMSYYWYEEVIYLLRALIPDVKLKLSVEETSHNKVTYSED